MSNSIFEINNEEIDLSILFKFLSRNKILILLITFISTFTTIISTYVRKPVWIGEFQIILQKNNNSAQNDASTSFKLYNRLLMDGMSDLKTQVAILKSPLVLSPVFEKVKEDKLQKKIDISNIDYKGWLASSLEITLQKGTSVLDIKYKDKDKDVILNSLNLISSRYQEFSKRDRQREINQGIEYLKEQKKDLKVKADESQKRLSEFISINNLGMNENFYASQFSPNILSNEENDLSTKNFNKSSGRFVSHFRLLEEYEALLIEKSAILKPNSAIIKNLELKIKNLKESLKRPQKILAEYKALNVEAGRDEYFLNSITSQLELLKLQKAKKQMPWELISQPKVNQLRFSPKRKQEAIFSFIVSFIIAVLIAIIFEFRSKKIFTTKDFKRYINFPILSYLYFNRQKLNINSLTNFANKDNVSSIEKICLVYLSFDKDKYKEIFDSLFRDSTKLNFVFIEDIDTLKKYEKVYLVAEMSNIYKNEMPLINQYLTLISGSIGGVFVIEKDNLF